MATRTPTTTYNPNGIRGLTQATWTGLLQSSSDVGAAVELPGSDRTYQLSGTLGVGGAVIMQGSEDGTNWGSLHDLAGNVLTLDAIGELFVSAEAPRYVRPSVSAGNGTTDITVTMSSRQ